MPKRAHKCLAHLSIEDGHVREACHEARPHRRGAAALGRGGGGLGLPAHVPPGVQGRDHRLE